ncbi:hypothetical protein FSP39_017440 [Pinctada imbricata]|uniref:Death domain-containing protein n=1 Tax=Pinctada imbricata TaxID=66713 RepID=A0AA88YDA6_PINIB|nr:hypothetical protein FSP39_017440 [Pinctada imbricata]
MVYLLSPTNTDSPDASDGRSLASSVALDSRSASTVSGSTFGGGGLSRVPSMQRGSQLSMQSSVNLQIETPQPEEYNPRSDGIRKASGKTLLHHCANSGDKMNVEILLKRGAQTNKIDKQGQTPLHYAAKKDYVDLIEMLAVHGANLDFPEEKTGQSALHMAVGKNYLATVQILMFSGADVNVKDKDGQWVRFSSVGWSDGSLLQCRIVSGFASSVYDGQWEIYVQTVEVLGGRKTYSERLDIMFDFTSCALDDRVSMMCRRQPVEYSDANFYLNDDEEIFSDVITYRLPRKGRATPATVTLPIFGNPNANEELLLKSNMGHQINIDSISEENSKHYCHVTADLAKFDAFVIISRTIHEAFDVSAESLTVTSRFVPEIEIAFPEGTFDEPTKVKLEITNSPNPDIFEADDVRDVYSVTPFTRLYTDNNEGPKRDVQMTLPLPAEYGVGRKCGVETKKDVNLEKLRTQVQKIYMRARLREYTVGFIVMSKQMGDSDSFRVVTECCHIDTIEDRKFAWMNEGYEDQSSSIAPFIIKSKQHLKICSSKNFKNSSDAEDCILQFHPKRRNYLCLAIELPSGTKRLTGNVQIYAVPKETNKENAHEVREQKSKFLKQINVELVKNLEQNADIPAAVASHIRPPTRAPTMLHTRAPSSRGIDYSKEAKGDPSFKGFTNDVFLKELTDDMDDEWYKVIVLMGWPYYDVEKVIEDPGGSQKEKIWHFLLQWRNSNRTHDDLGMASLITALSKGGRRDICTTVQLKMREWSAVESNQKSKFYRWIVKAFKDSDLMNPGDYPYPMCDQFLVLLVENTRARFEVADTLDVQESDVQKVMNDNTCPGQEQKMLKILLMARDREKDQLEALKTLVYALESSEVVSGKRWIVMACNKWYVTVLDNIFVSIYTKKDAFVIHMF